MARLTGEQTIYQMIELAQQVKQRGGKPLAPLEYKSMYHDRLMQKMQHRREELRQGKVLPGTIPRPRRSRLPREHERAGSETLLREWDGSGIHA